MLRGDHGGTGLKLHGDPDRFGAVLMEQTVHSVQTVLGHRVKMFLFTSQAVKWPLDMFFFMGSNSCSNSR